MYDLYAVTEDGKPSGSVSLHYYVNLSQDTGEDWVGANLILNTPATDVLNAWIPHPDDLIVEPPSPPPEEESKESEELEDLGFGHFDDVAPSRSAPPERSHHLEESDDCNLCSRSVNNRPQLWRLT